MRFRDVVHCNICTADYVCMLSLAVIHKQECVRLWCIEIDRSVSLLLCVTFDVLKLLGRFSEPGHALAPAVACAAPVSSQLLQLPNWLQPTSFPNCFCFIYFCFVLPSLLHVHEELMRC